MSNPDLREDRAKSSEEIEREVESTRAGLTATLEELKDRMSPGQLVDQIFDFSKDSGGREFMSSLGGAVRANPIPVLLIGAGIAWMMTSGARGGRYIETDDTDTSYAGGGNAKRRGGRYRRQDFRWADEDAGPSSRRGRKGRLDQGGDMPSSAYVAGGGTASDLADRAGEWGSRAAHAGGEAWESATEAGSHLGHEAASFAARAASAVGHTAASLAGHAASAVGHAASAAYETVAGAAGHAAAATGDAAYAAGRTVGGGAYSAGRAVGERAYSYGTSAGRGAYEYGRSAADRAYGGVEEAWQYGRREFGSVLEQQPLVVGALGLAIGAAIGAALPSTEAENRLMGDRADELKSRARELASEQYEHARNVAGQMYEEIREEVDAQGLASIPGEIIGEVTERVRTVAETARTAAKETAEEALGSGKSTSGPAARPQTDLGKLAGEVGSVSPKPASPGGKTSGESGSPAARGPGSGSGSTTSKS